ncbi:MAG: type II toxin-antitoxin system PemK/MazF family toxin [Myxococcales bacterium]|nr:type II toxin-antitoxin system PemK/MazF family toxin [Myxococcales bacterium]
MVRPVGQVVRRGEVYWFTFVGDGSAPGGRRPALVVQHDRFNRSAIKTTVLASITSNLRLADMPGNVRLKKGEANLTKACVVNVSQLHTVDQSKLHSPIGTLSDARIKQVRDGLALVLGP